MLRDVCVSNSSRPGRIDTIVVLDARQIALLWLAPWHRHPQQQVTVLACQFTGNEWQTFQRGHGLVSRLSRRGN